MAFAIRQQNANVRKRGPSDDVVEADIRLVFAVMAIGIAAGALFTPSNGQSKVTEQTKVASMQR